MLINLQCVTNHFPKRFEKIILIVSKSVGRTHAWYGPETGIFKT